MIARSKGRGGVSVAGVLVQLLPPVLLFALFAGVGIFHVTARVMVVEAGYRLSRLQQENRALVDANANLELQLATQKSALSLEPLARGLGMGPPAPGAVLTPARVQARRPVLADRQAERSAAQ